MRKLLAALALLVPLSLPAAPIAQAITTNEVITLFSEKCTLPAVTNLPYRATHVEGTRSLEACYGVIHGVVFLYSEDGFVFGVPEQHFRAASGI